jgi:hypothetical protein
MPAMRYPGLEILAEVEASVQTGATGPTDAELDRLIDRLEEARARGLPFRVCGSATTTFFLLVQDAIERHDPSKLPDPLVTRVLEAAARGWTDTIPLAPADDRRVAWTVLDILHANRVRRHLAASAQTEAEAFLERSAIPAPRTALALAARRAEEGLKGDGIVAWLDHASRSPDESDLVAVEDWRARVEVRVAEARAVAPGRTADAVGAVWDFHEQVTEVLGGDFVARDTAPAGSREASDLRETARVLTERAVALAAEVDTRDPLVESLVEYEMGRIEAGTGATQSAARIFDRLAGRAFALHDVALAQAAVAMVKGYPEDALAAIEHAARRIPLLRRPGGIPGDIERACREAGGDPAALGLPEAPESFVIRAQQNRVAADAAFEATIGPDGDRARQAYWATREERLGAYLGRLLPAEDFAAALAGRPGRHFEFDEAEAAAVGLDENPALDGLDRDLFLQSVAGPVPSARVAGEVLQWIARMEERGLAFADLAARFPGWARSPEVAVRRAEVLPVGRREAWQSLLDGYDRLDPPPDRAILAVLERGLDVLSDGDGWRDAVERLRRLWVRNRGSVGDRAAFLLRRVALTRLRSPEDVADWPELANRLLDTRPDDGLQAWLAEWLEGQGEAAGGEVGLRLGWTLAARLSAPHQERARVWAASRLDRTLAAARGPQDVLAVLTMCGDSPALRLEMAEWFDRWSAPLEVRARVGESLSHALDGAARDRVRLRTRALLFELFQRVQPREQIGILERIATLFPNDESVARAVREARQGGWRLALKIVLLLAAGAAVSAGLWMLSRSAGG